MGAPGIVGTFVLVVPAGAVVAEFPLLVVLSAIAPLIGRTPTLEDLYHALTGLFDFVGPRPFLLATALTTMLAAAAAIGFTTIAVLLWSAARVGRSVRSIPRLSITVACVYLRKSLDNGEVMTSPDPTRRRILLALSSGLALLAGCGDTDTTPEPAPPPETGTPTPETPGPGPGEETPPGTEEIQQGTGTPVPDDVVFSKPGGGEVPATVYGSGDCGVVLVPQEDMGRQSWDQDARRLQEEGYLAVAIDEGDERRDDSVVGAVQYLRDQRGVETVVVVGASVGGEAALRATAANPEVVDALVALSPTGGSDVAGDLDLPMLLLVGEDDGEYLGIAQDIVEGAPGAAQLVTYDGSAHGQELLDSPHADDVRGRIGDFLADVCAPDGE